MLPTLCTAKIAIDGTRARQKTERLTSVIVSVGFQQGTVVISIAPSGKGEAMISAGNGICKHYDCSNRTNQGYCRTSVCINPNYSQIKNEAYIPVEWNSYFHAYICTRPNCSYWETAPIEDAVCVVRCKDCENAIDIGKEYLLCPMIDCRVKTDFFCAYGERRT